MRNTVGFARAGYKGVSAFGMAAGKVLGKAGGALAIVGMGLDIWKIVSTGKDISNGSKSELGKGITKHIYIGGGEIAERFWEILFINVWIQLLTMES